MKKTSIETLQGIANQLRIHSIAATTAAGSGHPTSCCSAADLVAAILGAISEEDLTLAGNGHQHVVGCYCPKCEPDGTCCPPGDHA